MAIHLLIIDALNLIRRIHAVQGSPCLVTCQNAIGQLIQHTQPTHAVAVFDEDDRADSWRHQSLPDYKAGRTPMPDNLFAEMPSLKAGFEAQGIACWHSAGNEADDLAATLAAKVSSGGHQVTIVSTDKGYCQLLAPNVQIRDYFQKRSLDELYDNLEGVPEKWRKKLEEHREQAFICKRVSTLQTDVALDGNLQQLRLP